jgi:hypothetical protein
MTPKQLEVSIRELRKIKDRLEKTDCGCSGQMECLVCQVYKDICAGLDKMKRIKP